VAVSGGAGMFAFEREAGTFDSYPEALWWTAMLLTTMGSERWPQTPEGRALCLLLSLYGFAVFGYITATLATWFIGADAKAKQRNAAVATELARIRARLDALPPEALREPGRSGAEPR
jgi:voltage-gated potassium channel